MGIFAAFELFQIGITPVFQFLMNTDFRGVITVNRRVFDGSEKAFFDGLWTLFIFADSGEQFNLLRFRSLSKLFTEFITAHLINRCNPVAPFLFGLFIGDAQYGINVFADSRFFRARAGIICRNNSFGQFNDGAVLRFSEELESTCRSSGGFRWRFMLYMILCRSS